MSNHTGNTGAPRTPSPAEGREEILIGRVIDGEASPVDWADLERFSQKDPAVWERLALAQRAHACLARAVDDHIAIADLVDLPRRSAGRVRPLELAGWLAAAAVALAWVGNNVLPGMPGARRAPETLSASNGPRITPDRVMGDSDTLLANYLRDGMADGLVVGEMPSLLISQRPLDDGGGYEVTFVRQIMERRHVAELGVLQGSETGQKVAVPYGELLTAGGDSVRRVPASLLAPSAAPSADTQAPATVRGQPL